MADLQLQYQSIRRDIDDKVHAVMENCRFILGENVQALETKIAESSGAVYGIGVASGTDALLLSLAALGIGRGDEVITTPFTFVATTEAIALLGATPVFADIDPKTYTLDPKSIEEKITSRTKAILPVHLYGRAADIAGITDIAKRHDLKIVWDGAQAIGVESNGRHVGAYGDAVTLSFFPTKNLGGAGDGGMVLVNDAALADNVKCLRFHGSGGTYSYKIVGYCSRLDEIQAAIIRAKLPYLAKWTEARRCHASTYQSELSGLDITLPEDDPNGKHVYHQFTIRSKDRDKLKEYLASKGVSTGIYYPSPLHLEDAYKHLGYAPGDIPEAERACREVLSLPVYPEMTDEQLAYVVEAVKSFFK